jgi:CxxC motif-containing protein (DUF1111 family)
MKSGGEKRAFLGAATLSGTLLAGGALGQQAIQPRMGDPVLGLTAAERARFDTGGVEFNHTLIPAEGLGPIMNDTSCAHCHAQPQAGGSGALKVTRFGKAAVGGNPFDPLANLGGSLLQFQATTVPPEDCQEVVPPEADVVISRITPSTFGIGLLEAILDADILAYVSNPPPGVSGIRTW